MCAEWAKAPAEPVPSAWRKAPVSDGEISAHRSGPCRDLPSVEADRGDKGPRALHWAGARNVNRCLAPEALASVILVLGAPRSGTTWLAKIIDSHPDVLYRHEPDETLPAPLMLTAATLPALLADWILDRGARAASKRPLFPKAGQPAWARWLRALFAGAANAASRLPAPLDQLTQVAIPDLLRRPASRTAIKSVRWGERAAIVPCTLPASRTIFVLRHPCGQVASLMRGVRQRRFDLKAAGTDMPFDEAAALCFAAARGVGNRKFQALPDAAKYAWSWRAYNEPAYAALAAQPNVHVVLYEALCARPEVLARRILAFAGLDWNTQTANFVVRSSTHQGGIGYYGVLRDAVAAAEDWRQAMPTSDQRTVRSVVAASPLTRFWPDLIAPS